MDSTSADPSHCETSIGLTPLGILHCDWPGCKSQRTYSSARERQDHTTDIHVAEVFGNWPGRCTWPGCVRKSVFKTSNRLESHVYNIHITPLRCTVAKCHHETPFERKADLERHVATIHNHERKYRCFYKDCPYAKDGFSRKDKLKQHVRTDHGPSACQFRHCGFRDASENHLSRHQIWEHSGYECGLGSCQHGGSSKFCFRTLKEHSKDVHKLDYTECEAALVRIWENLDYRTMPTLTITHFPDGIPNFTDCEECKKWYEASQSEGKNVIADA